MVDRGRYLAMSQNITTEHKTILQKTMWAFNDMEYASDTLIHIHFLIWFANVLGPVALAQHSTNIYINELCRKQRESESAQANEMNI